MCRHYSAYNGRVYYQFKVKQVYWNLTDCVMVFKLLFMRCFNLEFWSLNLLILLEDSITCLGYCVCIKGHVLVSFRVNTHFGLLSKSALLWIKIH